MNRTARLPEALFTLGLSPAAIALYAVFLIHRNKRTGRAWPDRKTMLKMSGIGVNGLTGRIDELTQRGLITRVRKRRGNVYEYLVHVIDQNHETVSLTVEPESRNRDSQNHETVSLVSESRNRESGPRKSAENPAKPESRNRDRNQLNQVQRTNKERTNKARPSSQAEVEAFALECGLPATDGAAFWLGKEGNGWKNGTANVKDWKATFRNWQMRGFHPSQKANGANPATSRRI